MQVLDLFNTRYERQLQEGGVDNLEARRIDDLNMRMLELLDRAKEPAYRKNPGALAGLKRQFQKIKAERDSYFKINPATGMNDSGTLGTTKGRLDDGQVTPTATGLRHHAKPGVYGGFEKEKDPLAKLDKGTTNSLEKSMGIKFDREKKYQGGLDVDEGGIPGNVPTEKIPGKEDLLKGKGRSYYEDQKKNLNLSKGVIPTEPLPEHGGGIGPKQRWQDLMPEQTNPNDDWYDDEDLRLRSGDYVRDTQDGEYGEVFRMQGDPYERRVRILDRDGRGWYIEPSRLTRVDPTDPDVQRYFGKNRVRDMDESDMADQVKKVFKDKAGRPVGEIGIDPESSPGNGEWYVHHYATGYSVVGFDSAAEAKRELLYVHKHPDAVEGHESTKEQGVAEARRVKGGDYQLKLVDKQSDDDTDLDDVVMDYYFDVYQNGQKIGTAEGDSYYGELVVKPEFDRQFKLSSFHDKDHPLMQQFEKIENGVAESSTAPIIVPKRRAKEKKPTKFHIPHKASDYVPPALAMASAEALDRIIADPSTKETTRELAKKARAQKKKGVAEGDVIPFKRPESKIKPEVRRVFIRHLLDQGYTNDEISRMNDEQFTKAYYGIKGKKKVKDVRPNWTDDLPDELDEQGVAEGWSDAVVSRRTGQPRTPYAVYIKGRKWKDFANDDHAEAVANKLRAKFKQEGKDPSVITIAPTDMTEARATKTRLDPKCWTGKKIGNPKTKVKGGVRVNNCVPAESVNEEQDTSGVESAIIRRIMVAHTDLLRQFGPDKVMQAAEEVAYNVGDVDEIGTSDVSAYVAQVKQILGAV